MSKTKYKVKVYPFYDGEFIQRDEYDQEEEFSDLPQLKRWIKTNCDLRHNVLTKSEVLDMKLHELKECEFCEVMMNKAALAIFEYYK